MRLYQRPYLFRIKRPASRQNTLNLLYFASAIFATSVITVTAASYLGATDVFKGFYSQFFKSETPEFTQNQKDFLEKHGVGKIGGFSQDGINLNVEGLIGDRNYLFCEVFHFI